MGLVKKTFKTRDSRGCQFTAKCYLTVEPRWDANKNKYVSIKIEADYYSDVGGFHTKTLKELQKKVGELP